MLTLYYPQKSWLHSLPAGAKILSLIVAATAVFLVDDLPVMVGIFAASIILFASSRIPLIQAWRQLRPALYMLVIIFVAQLFLADVYLASFVILRFGSLIILASLVTLTSKTSEIIAALERAMFPFRRILPVEKISLAISLTLRFIPLLIQMTSEVREAQKCRGLENSLFAIAVPMIVRTLKMGNEIAEAIEARAFEAEQRS